MKVRKRARKNNNKKAGNKERKRITRKDVTFLFLYFPQLHPKLEN